MSVSSNRHAAGLVVESSAPHAVRQGNIIELERAFKLFSESSQRLEARYSDLLNEVEELRAQLRRKEEEVKRSERLSTLGEMAAAIAHEVRNPLGAIKLFVSLLRDDMNDRPSSLELLQEISKSIVTMENVVSNILQFSRASRPALAPVNLHTLIQEQITHLAGQTGNVQIVTALNANPLMMASEHGLRQVIYNLVLNAVQALRSGGVVTILTEDCAGGITLRVRDNGAGIPADVAEQLFEPFVTTKNEGTGLGLAVVKQIVEQHRGSIVALNDAGAVFEVTLPRKA